MPASSESGLAVMRNRLRRLLRSIEGTGRTVAAAIRPVPWVSIAVLIAGLALAMAARSSLLDFKSDDYFASLKPWYNTIRSEGFAAFGTDFSTYNPPYLYLLYLIARFLPDTPPVIAVKLPGLVADFVCALFVYLVVGLKFPTKHSIAFAAAMLTLFAPSVLLNSAFWGQADSVFTAGMLGCVYYLMKRQSVPAMISLGIGLAFKLQTIFFAPIILALCLRRMVSWRSVAAVPIVLFLAVVPAWIAGRPLPDLLNIYLYQASQFEFITMNAASAYTWVPDTKQAFNLFYFPGVIMGAAAAYALFVIAYKAPAKLSESIVLELSLAATIIIPFFLPKMHERYFYPADILSIALAFYYPRLFYLPILIGGASFLSYEPFLFQTEIVPLPVLSGVMLVAIALLMYHLARLLFHQAPVHENDEAVIPRSQLEGPIP